LRYNPEQQGKQAMAQVIRKVLVAIRDTSQPPRAMLRKAVSIAKASGASVELFHAINEPVSTDVVRGAGSGHDTREQMHEIAEGHKKRLERMAVSAADDVRINTHAEWDYPPHEAVIRRAQVARADLVIAAAQPRKFGGRLLLANTDWELIRHCPAPLLIVKSTRDYTRPVVLASVDPFHAHAKPAALEDRILEMAGDVARQLRGEVHTFHAYMPLATAVPSVVSQPVPVWMPEEAEKHHTKRVQQAFDALAKSAGIPPARRHLRMGDVQSQLLTAIKRTGARIVVMGAVSRSGLRRIFIGSTAERVLDQLPCDVLIVKPRAFKSSVSSRRQPPFGRGV
jgi:universal stress protein E